VDNDQESTEDPLEAVPTAEIITIQLTGFDDVVPQFANIVHANNDSQVFQVTFSQVMPPIIMGPEDSQALMETKTLPGRVIARLIFTPASMEQVIDVLQTQLGRYRETRRQLDIDTGEPVDG
jgi:hypothetical protein